MKNNYLLDTNVIIYYANGIFDSSNNNIDSYFEESFNISIMSKIEFLGWADYREDPSLFKQACDFINSAFTLYLDDDIAHETIIIRQQYKIKIPDAIIAATAKINNFVLVTANSDDFKNIGLELINPLEDIT